MAVRDRIALFKGYQAVNAAAASVGMSRIYAFESTTEPAGIKDLEHRYIYVNEAYRELLRLPLTYDVTGKTFQELTGLESEFSDNIRKHENLVMRDKKASFAREFFPFGTFEHHVPYFFYRIPHMSDAGHVTAIEFFAVSWHEFSGMYHQGSDSPVQDHKLLTPYSLLTDKQWSALYLYCTGLTVKEIANTLGISLSGVRKRIDRGAEITLSHLQLDTNTEIMPEIVKLGWLNFTPPELSDGIQQFTIYHPTS
ncbi:helix-turn-helix transcriptional regulator (plasmid) [Citrobacter sp. OP27]